MSQSQNNLDNVPVVLAWKLPLLPNITEDMVEKFFLPQLGPTYDYSLENKILAKISQWEVSRDEAFELREERIKARHEEKRRRMEAEGTKLKEQLTQVSYPSPDDFSSSDEEHEIAEKKPIFELLTPTVIGGLSSAKSPCTLWNGNNTTFGLEIADFEKAPDLFENMELNTIDDLDVLAQVLTKSHIHSNESPPTPSSQQDNNEIIRENDKKEISPEPIQNGFYVPMNNYYYAPQINYHQTPTYAAANITTPTYSNHEPIEDEENSQTSKLKSKSVPNIFKELEEELAESKQRRIRNNSQSTDKANRFIPTNVNTKNPYKKGNLKIIKNNICSSRNCDELLTKLPESLKIVVENISQMGFPIDRVCRIAEQFHGDDKKMIEHLIPLSELLDFGFEEQRISEALIKFDNNKEKALDFLIS